MRRQKGSSLGWMNQLSDEDQRLLNHHDNRFEDNKEELKTPEDQVTNSYQSFCVGFSSATSKNLTLSTVQNTEVDTIFGANIVAKYKYVISKSCL